MLVILKTNLKCADKTFLASDKPQEIPDKELVGLDHQTFVPVPKEKPVEPPKAPPKGGK